MPERVAIDAALSLIVEATTLLKKVLPRDETGSYLRVCTGALGTSYTLWKVTNHLETAAHELEYAKQLKVNPVESQKNVAIRVVPQSLHF